MIVIPRKLSEDFLKEEGFWTSQNDTIAGCGFNSKFVGNVLSGECNLLTILLTGF
jgi:hypothetical protein